MILPLVVTALAIAAGLAGFELVPDTGYYARDGFHLWPAPLANIGGIVGGQLGVIVLHAIASGLCVALVPRGRRRLGFTAIALYWLLFPGVDALGTLFVLLMLRASTKLGRVAGYALAALVHPVNALTSTPWLVRRGQLATIGVAALTVAAIVGVGLLDAFSTTDRYALPLLAGVLSSRSTS